MNDRELLELAAKAADTEVWSGRGHQADMMFRSSPSGDGVFSGVQWNPLTDDGDAMRLAVKLKLQVLTGQGPNGDITWVRLPEDLDIEGPSERHGKDALAATRRAIVRAAALIGENQ